MKTTGSKPLIGIQYGFLWETLDYREHRSLCAGQPIIYYQFTSGAAGAPVHVVPDSCIDLLFCCDGRRPHAKVCGTVLKRRDIQFLPHTLYFGIRLSAKQSALLPGLSLKEVIEVQAPLEDVLKAYAYLSDQIAELPDFAARISCCERELYWMTSGASLPNANALVDYCVHAMERSCGTISIRQLADETGYSERYVRSKFEQSLGIPPKLYNRIMRFQHALGGIMSDKNPLADVAASIGYFDQAHLIKEFKTFSHWTPAQIRSHT